MSKSGIRIVLALVIVLVLVIGSVSTVSAAKPVPTASAAITDVEPIWGIHYTISWDNYAVYSYSVYFYDNTSSPPTLVSGQSGPFVKKTKTFSYSGEASGSAIIIDGLRSFTVTLTIYDKNGDVLATSSDTWPYS
jgi:hypothetical protein